MEHTSLTTSRSFNTINDALSMNRDTPLLAPVTARVLQYSGVEEYLPSQVEDIPRHAAAVPYTICIQLGSTSRHTRPNVGTSRFF